MKNLTYLKLIIIIGVLVAIAVITVFLFRPKPSPFSLSEDPIATIGHGSFLNHEGKPIEINEPLIRQIQDLYLRKLSDAKLAVREGGVFDEQKIKATQDLVSSTVKNDVLANALFIEWLIEQRKPRDEAQFSLVNNALRWRYVLTIQKDPILPDKANRWGKGIPDDEAKKLEEKDIKVYAITNSRTPAYIQECLDAGVPVPSNMFGTEWKNLGEIEDEFISQMSGLFAGVALKPELMIHVSNNPEGFCLALPRYLLRGDEREAELFGVICLGTRTSKACFFDNPNGTFFLKDGVINFRERFVGGFDLVANSQGTCTDCHAGENPYVVHPAKRPFMRILDDNLDGNRADANVPSTMPPRWYEPIVVGTWPQNPGPTNLLDAVDSTGRCDGCHRAGTAGGRFPDLSFPLPGYCNSVLSNAVRRISAGGTMPYGLEGLPAADQDTQRAQFVPHINALTSYCGLTRDDDGHIAVATPTANRGFVSAPLVVGPVYACATQVAVRGAVLDAKVTLFLDRPGEPRRDFNINPARSRLQLDFTALPALVAGDVLTAIQEDPDGAVSGPSAPVTVRNYREDYPRGLERPVIDPTTVYACAEAIAVRHVPGATITVLTNGDPATARSFQTSTGWSAIGPAGAPFSEGDTFTVRASLCGDMSDPSDVVSARRPPPAPLPKPAFNPSNIYHGQELLTIEDIIFGARVTLRETGSGWTGAFSTPVNWFPEYDIKTAMGRPIQTGDDVQAMQGLCATTSDWALPGAPHDCERLPAPHIERPIGGARFVIVSRSVPGARVMVYDSTGVEIGDGSGTVIMLSRAIVGGETLTVVQRVGRCTSPFAYIVRASRGQ